MVGLVCVPGPTKFAAIASLNRVLTNYSNVVTPVTYTSRSAGKLLTQEFRGVASSYIKTASALSVFEEDGYAQACVTLTYSY